MMADAGNDEAPVLERLRLTIVLPCLNEERALPVLYRRLCAELGDRSDLVTSLVVVDDGSTDGTWDVIESLSRDDIGLRTKGVRLDGRHGKSAAVAVGIRESLSDSDLIAVMDSDGQHDPAYLAPMIDRVRELRVPCIGVRADYRRSLLAAVGTSLLKSVGMVAGIRFDPDSSEYMVMPHGVARRLTSMSRFGIIPLVPVVQSVARDAQTLPIRILPRVDAPGETRWNLSALWQKGILYLLADPWTLLPRLAALVGLLIAFLGIYGIVIGIQSMVAGTFLGIGSVIVAVVAIGAALAMLVMACLGVMVIALQISSQSAGYSPVVERAPRGPRSEGADRTTADLDSHEPWEVP